MDLVWLSFMITARMEVKYEEPANSLSESSAQARILSAQQLGPLGQTGEPNLPKSTGDLLRSVQTAAARSPRSCRPVRPCSPQ